jgi:hypothetical protein
MSEEENPNEVQRSLIEFSENIRGRISSATNLEIETAIVCLEKKGLQRVIKKPIPEFGTGIIDEIRRQLSIELEKRNDVNEEKN